LDFAVEELDGLGGFEEGVGELVDEAAGEVDRAEVEAGAGVGLGEARRGVVEEAVKLFGREAASGEFGRKRSEVDLRHG
jgi:hypothetical protein